MHTYLKRTWAEVHLDRLGRNYNKCKGFVSENSELVAVVKANGYGHGDTAVAPYLQDNGVDWFAVSNINEAKHLRNVGIAGEIIILGYTDPQYAPELCEYDIIQAVTGLEHANELAKFVPLKEKLRVHISVDTGMGRIGVKHDTIKEITNECREISKIEGILAEGIFTHLAVADSDGADDVEYTKNQKETILAVSEELKRRKVNISHVHYLNSAGATYLKDEDSTLSRFGIMLYGLHPNYQLKLPCDLEPVMELKTVVSHVKEINEGEYISYGRTFKSDKNMKIATLSIGYADGYSRLLSSKSEVLINGKRAKSVGRICMDQMMVDVTGIDVKVGDTATLFGIDGDDKITADDLAGIYGTIGYEVVCGITKRVPRVIYDNDKIIDILE